MVAVSIIIFILGIRPRYLELFAPPPRTIIALKQAGLSSILWTWSQIIPDVILAVSFTIIGISIYTQKKNDFTIYVVSLMLISSGTTILNVADAFSGAFPNFSISVQFIRAVSWTTMLLTLYIFPNGKFNPKWVWILFIGWLIFTWSWFFFPSLPHNPTQHGAFTTNNNYIWYLHWFGSGIAVQIYRWFNFSNAEEKQQSKWVVFGLFSAVVITFWEELPSFMYPILVQHSTPHSVWYAMISTIAFAIGMLAIPISIVFSIQEQRLWQIDYVINRSIVYSLLLVFILGILMGMVFLFQDILTQFIPGNAIALAIPMAIAILLIITMPLRKLLQTLVDKNLFGIHIDYEEKKFAHPTFILERQSIGSKVGEYIIEHHIWESLSASTYKARRETTEKTVALKILHKQLAEKAHFRKEFRQEAHILAQLDHPNIVQLLDYGDHNDCPFIVMEYVSDLSLKDLIQEQAPFSLSFTISILEQLAKGLEHAHQRGIYHLDLKPSNILLQVNLNQKIEVEPVLIDFGIATNTNYREDLSWVGIRGSFEYISPEQIRSSDYISNRADIYALGIISYEMLTGRLPYQAVNPGQLVFAHLLQPAPNPLKLVPHLPDRTALSIMRAIEKNAENRFESVSLFVKSLIP